jgi:hypothetical protein
MGATKGRGISLEKINPFHWEVPKGESWAQLKKPVRSCGRCNRFAEWHYGRRYYCWKHLPDEAKCLAALLLQT